MTPKIYSPPKFNDSQNLMTQKYVDTQENPFYLKIWTDPQIISKKVVPKIEGPPKLSDLRNLTTPKFAEPSNLYFP